MGTGYFNAKLNAEVVNPLVLFLVFFYLDTGLNLLLYLSYQA